MHTNTSLVLITTIVLLSIVAVAVFVPGENTKEVITTIATIASPVIGIIIMLLRTDKMGTEVSVVSNRMAHVDDAVRGVTDTVEKVKAQGIDTHAQVNSRLDELKESIAKVEFAKGLEEGFRKALAVAVEERAEAERNRTLGKLEERRAEHGRQAVEVSREEGHAEGKIEEQAEAQKRQAEKDTP